MSLAQQMKQYEQQLLQTAPVQGVPVTEIVLFKLIAEPTQETFDSIKQDFVDNAITGTGIKRISWGPSLDDSKAFALMFDWEKIEDHWAFWQKPEFEPVMACINKWFEPGRPLVRHYQFDPPGMLDQEFTRVWVWDNGSNEGDDKILAAVVNEHDKAVAKKAAFAVDPGELSWCCVLAGYESEDKAREGSVTKRFETHLLKLRFLTKQKALSVE